MALCFSPVGESLRGRARKFPALINCTVIDWFHPWPEDALLSVAVKFLAETDMDSDEIRDGIEKFMPYSFKTVGEYSDTILAQERRFVYCTPKSFLELIKLFKSMLNKKYGEVSDAKDKYELGVVKLTETGEIVGKLEENLKLFSVEVEAKKVSADEQAEIVGKEKAIVDVENEKATLKQISCNKIETEASAIASSAEADLAAAIPLVERAMKALDGLDVKDFSMLKALQNPPNDVKRVFTCVINILAGSDPDIPVDKKGRLKTENPWKVALGTMKNPAALFAQLNGLKAKIDGGEIPAHNFKANNETIADENFTPEIIVTKSQCAAGLCDFVINITAYYNVVVSVEPKKKALAEAKAKEAAAKIELAEVNEQVSALQAKLKILQDAFDLATNEKETAMREALKCENKLNLANRLVNALGSEQERWSQSIIDMGELLKVIIGDVLLASSFVSYVGPFNKSFRDKILADFVLFF